MKKLILLCSLGLFGSFALASTELPNLRSNYVFLNEISNQQETISSAIPPSCSDWITVMTWCGIKFYLCADNYNSFEEMTDAADYFTQVKCGDQG